MDNGPKMTNKVEVISNIIIMMCMRVIGREVYAMGRALTFTSMEIST